MSGSSLCFFCFELDFVIFIVVAFVMSRNKDAFLSLIPDNGNAIKFGGGYMAQSARKWVITMLLDMYFFFFLARSHVLFPV